MEHDPESDRTADEIRLVERTGAGDRTAFRELYERYHAALFALAIRMVGNVSEAEELLQDAFVKIWHGAATYDARKSRPFTWAVTLTRRTCIDHLRRHRRTPVSEELAANLATTMPPAVGESPRQAAVARDETERVLHGLAELPAPQRAALELALFSGLTHREISEQLGQPVGTVKTWIRRGLLDLRATLNRSAP